MSNTDASSLITEMLDNVSRISTGTTRSGVTSAARGLTILNRTLQALATEHDFVELKRTYSTATVASTKNYSFPTSYSSIVDLILINGTDSRKLRPMMPDQFEKYIPYPEGDTTGVPSIYIPFGDNFDLNPIPDAAYTMKCRTVILPTTITDSATTIDYTPDKDDLIVAGMSYRGLMHLQMFEDAAVWKAEYKILLKAAILADENIHLDWSPKGEGFNATGDRFPIGNYWNRIDVRSNI